MESTKNIDGAKKVIEAMWEKVSVGVIPFEADEIQRRDMKIAYLFGMKDCFAIQTKIAEYPETLALRMMEGYRVALDRVFMEEVEKIIVKKP